MDIRSSFEEKSHNLNLAASSCCHQGRVIHFVCSIDGHPFGKQTTQRAAHAKGVVLLGKFVPSAEAASVSKALHFKHEVPVTVRFSANSGILKIADADPRAAPRGLAIKFRLPDGSDTDLVTHSYDGFPAKNPEEFRQFFLALAGSKPGIPSPTPIEVFQETHPAAKTFLTTRDPPPVSYATTTYFGVNSFKFVNKEGAVTIGRYQLILLKKAAVATQRYQ